MARAWLRLAVCLLALSSTQLFAATPGLEVIKNGKVTGACPLKHTDVRAGVSGFVARVNVVQQFVNTGADKIEAVYVFPLPEDSAVDDMTIQVGSRTIRGEIKRREEARSIYEKAAREGHVAALLDQERPNVFTQAVTNIEPGAQITVSISYVQHLKYEAGVYEFVFPTVVGPRYIPGSPTGKSAGGRALDTDQVPDASRITPPITPEGVAAGHEISIALAIDAGVAIQNVASPSHLVVVDRPTPNTASVHLKADAVLPNKDFIVRYAVAGPQISDAVLAHPDGKGGGYFSVILQPPARFPEYEVAPKEIVFVLDTSGSMMGFPIDKAKEVIDHALSGLYPGDTFNLITFSGDTHILFEQPVYPTQENLKKTRDFLAGQRGGGGTEMMKAIRAALDPSDAQDHVRVVCFLTDGEVGNDMQIIGEVQKHPKARVFSFGIGNSVNRFLLGGIAKAGRGEAEFVTLPEKAEAAAQRFYQRVRSPLLTDVSLEWQGVQVSEVYPERIPDLFAARPIVVTGRYSGSGTGKVVLHGTRAGAPFSREIALNLSSNGEPNDVLGSIWARSKIEDLMALDWMGMQMGKPRPDINQQITDLGLAHRLMTQFTSFVAVEETTVTTGGQSRKVQVPVEMPEGVSYEGIFGKDEGRAYDTMQPQTSSSYAVTKSGANRRIASSGVGSGSGGGAGAGTGGGLIGGVAGGYVDGQFNVGDMPAITLKSPPPPAKPQAATETVQVTGAGGPVEVAGINKPDTSRGQTTKPQSVERDERKVLESKFSPDTLKAFDCAKRQTSPCAGVSGGKVRVIVYLEGTAAANLDALRGLPLRVVKQIGKSAVLGELDASLLPKLAELKAVKFVTLERWVR